ncbi:MAG: triosephosphate isomerase (TIM) [Bacteroidetes bacterium]|nr:MAG: triosephosphate isomerase (TIM) [Bacteroidota bacterium]
MRRKIVAGNWKMNKTYSEAISLADDFFQLAAKDPSDSVLTIIAPPFPFLREISKCLEGQPGIFVAAQNCHHENSGAFTGEVSASMIRSADASHVIIGHSERRQYFAETGEQLLKKVNRALENELTVIFCIGETSEQRNSDIHFSVIRQQLEEVVFHLGEEILSAGKIILAYEPVWAIGTGVNASAAQAQEMHAFIREQLRGKFSAATVNEKVSILYGGSCNTGNAAELFAQPDVDGGLIGGASLKAADFAAIRRIMIGQAGL